MIQTYLLLINVNEKVKEVNNEKEKHKELHQKIT